VLIVLALAVFAVGTLAFAGRAPDEPAAGGAQPRIFFIGSNSAAAESAPGNASGRAARPVFSPAGIPISGEGLLCLSEAPLSRRFLREKSAVSVVMDPGLSVSANAPLGAFSDFNSVFPPARRLSDRIAVRK
jgi:hypothetical protein